MTWQIICDGAVIYDSGVDETRLESAVLTQEDNMAESLVYKIRPAHPHYNAAHILSSEIEVRRDGATLFWGRPIKEDYGFARDKTVICEGALAFLADTIVYPYAYSGTITGYIENLVEGYTDDDGVHHKGHNEQTPEARRLTVGMVTVTDPNDYITRESIEYPTAHEEVKAKLCDLLGGHLLTRREEGVTYLDYLADSSYMNPQTIDFGENLIDLARGLDGTETYTAVLPLGAKIEDEEGSETDERLGIADVNGGVEYVYSTEYAALYGMIKKVIVWDDVTLTNNLLAKANAALGDGILGLTSISVTAADLSTIPGAPSAESFRWLQYVRVKSDYHGIDTNMLITRMQTDLVQPTKTQITLGKVTPGLSGMTGALPGRVEAIEKNYTRNTEMATVRDSVEKVASEILQMANLILLQVSQSYVANDGYSTTIGELYTLIAQKADEISFTFVQNRIDELTNEVNASFENTEKYIRFTDGKIQVGKTGDPMSIQIAHDRQSFMYNNAEIAYITPEAIFIRNARILSTLYIGNFAWVSEENGSLSLKKVF